MEGILYITAALVIVIYPSILIMTSVSVVKKMRMLGSSSTGRARIGRNSPDRRPALCIGSQGRKVPWDTPCFGLSMLFWPRLTRKQLVSVNHKRQVKRVAERVSRKPNTRALRLVTTGCSADASS